MKLEKIIGKTIFAGGLIASLLFPSIYSANLHPTALNAQTANQEVKQEKKKKKEEKKEKKAKYPSYGEYLKSLKEKKEQKPETKPKQKQDLATKVNKLVLPKINLRVERPDGSLYGNFIVQSSKKEGTYVIDPNNNKLKNLPLPKDAVVFLETESPYKGHKIDMRMEDGTKTNTPLLNSSGGEYFIHYIDTSVYNLKPGTSDDFEILLEPKRQDASVVVPYVIELGPEPAEPIEEPTEEPVKEPEKKPTSELDEYVEEAKKSFVQPKTKDDKKQEKKNIYRLIAGIGKENMSVIDTQDSAFEFFSAQLNFHASINENLLLHINGIYNNHKNMFGSACEQNIDIGNIRFGGVYLPVKPLAVGAEGSFSVVEQTNTDPYNPNLNPFFKQVNKDYLILGKAGFANGFGNHALGILTLGGLHVQTQSLEDNDLVNAEFSLLNQNDLNLAYGLEAFVDLGRDPDSLLWLYAGAKWLNYHNIDKIVENSDLPKIEGGNVWNVVLTSGLKHKGFGAGLIIKYGRSTFNYLDGNEKRQKLFFIGGVINYSFNSK